LKGGFPGAYSLRRRGKRAGSVDNLGTIDLCTWRWGNGRKGAIDRGGVGAVTANREVHANRSGTWDRRH